MIEYLKGLLENEGFYAIVIDIILIIIVIYNIFSSAADGFISSVLKLVGYVMSYVLVWPVSKIVSKSIYDSFLRETISQSIFDRLVEKGWGECKDIQQLVDSIPCLKNYISNFNFNELIPKDDKFLIEISKSISDSLIFPMINIAMCVIVIGILSFVFSFVMRIFIGLFTKVSYIPIVGKINVFLGGILGAGKAFIIVVFISIGLNVLIMLSNDNIKFINSTVKEKTYILRTCNRFIKVDNISDIINEAKKTVDKLSKKENK